MRIETHIEALVEAGRRLADATDRAGLDAEVPSCPGWRNSDLVAHTGGVHRWATSFVITGRVGPYPPEEERAFFAAPAEGLIDWFRDGHHRLVEALRSADPGLVCWTFLPAPSPLAFWARRQAHETTIHSIDAGAAAELDPALAADGIEELLTGFFGRRRRRFADVPTLQLALRTTDTGQAWTVRVRAGQCEVIDDDTAPVSVTGTAADLYRLLWNRGELDRVEVSGDRSMLAQWRSRMWITWD